MHKKNLLLVLVLVLAMSFSGCLSFIFGGKPTTLEVTPNKVEIALDGETTVELKAVVKDNKGKVMEVKPEEIKWAIDNVEEEVEEAAEEGDGTEEDLVATLSKETGTTVTVTGERIGKAQITVTYDELIDEIPVVVVETIEEPEEPTNLVLFENFEGLTDVDAFWTAAYKSLPGDETKPLYYQTGGTITLVDDGLKLDGGRFTIGMPIDRNPTTSDDKDAGGAFDLSKPYKITVEFTGVEGTLAKKFQVYIDNNTTSAGSSIHNSIGSTASRPYSKELSGLPEGGVIELSPSVGTENSFVQLRVETSGIIVIKNFTIEHI